MKYIKIILTLLCIVSLNTILTAQSIEQTLKQIEELKIEISKNDTILNQKIEDLKTSNPIFADQDPFESDVEYLGRMSTAMPQLERIRKEYLGDKWKKMSILRGRIFETSNVTINLDVDKYNANTQEWEVTIRHNEYQQEVYNIILSISTDNARTFYQNWQHVKKTGILTIDIGDKIGLAKINLFDPISGLEFTHEFKPMLILEKRNKPILSKNGKWLLTTTYYNNYFTYLENTNKNEWYTSRAHGGYTPHALSVNNDLYAYIEDKNLVIYNINTKKKKKYEILQYGSYCTSIDFSPDGKFIAFNSYNIVSIFNIETEEIIKSLRIEEVDKVKFSPGGNFLAVSNTDRYDESLIYDLENQKTLFSDKRIKNIVFHPTKLELCFVIYGQSNHGLQVVNIDNGSISEEFNDGLARELYRLEYDTDFCISEDGNYLAIYTETEKSCIIYDISDLKAPIKLNKNFNIHHNLSFTMDNKYLVGTTKKNSYNNDLDTRMYRTMFEVEGDVLEKKRINAPPNLTTSVTFNEPSGNNYLDALETGFFVLELHNNGTGPAKGISISISPNKKEKLNYNNQYIEEIAPGETKSVSIPIEAYLDIMDGTHDFTFKCEEINGFSPSDIQIQISTKAYQKPDFYVVDFQIQEPTATRNGKIEESEIIDLNIRIGNKGKGSIGKGVYVKFDYNDDYVFITKNSATQVDVGKLAFNETYDIPLSFFVNSQCPDQIPIYIDIADETNLSTINHERLNLNKTSSFVSVKKTVIKGVEKNEELNIKGLTSDVDKNIPINEKVDNRFALVIGNEDYSTYQTALISEQNVDYAINDATIFKKYCLNTLGVKEDNIIFLTNATVGMMNQKIDLISKIVEQNGQDSELIVYYAGHGYPDEVTKVPYLIPVDVSASNLSSAIKLDNFYTKLTDSKASKITVFLDACFTGGGRISGLVASRGVVVKPKEGSLNGNIVVFSASSEQQAALPYVAEGHGMFTYYLLKKLQETNGEISMGELADYLEKQVAIQSLRINQREQEPEVNVSPEVKYYWRDWKFFLSIY